MSNNQKHEKMNTLTQKKSLKTSGSFFNWLMSNNESIPVVGDYATICFWSDRDVCIVREVSADFKRVVIEHCSTVAHESAKEIGMGHQNWVHTPNGFFQTLVYRNGGWKVEGCDVVFTKEFIAKAESEGNDWSLWKSLTEQQYTEIYGDRSRPQNVVEGITRMKKTFSKINILFGVCNYHYDWTF
jgi:uncharacterized protein YhfF